METVIFIAVIVILAILAIFVVPRWRMKRAFRQVIQIFRAHNALNIKSAKTAEELGLVPRGMLDGLFRGRDYKPFALNLLTQGDIIQKTEDDKLYLSEAKLMDSEFGRSFSFSR